MPKVTPRAAANVLPPQPAQPPAAAPAPPPPAPPAEDNADSAPTEEGFGLTLAKRLRSVRKKRRNLLKRASLKEEGADESVEPVPLEIQLLQAQEDELERLLTEWQKFLADQPPPPPPPPPLPPPPPPLPPPGPSVEEAEQSARQREEAAVSRLVSLIYFTDLFNSATARSQTSAYMEREAAVIWDSSSELVRRKSSCTHS